MCISAGVVGIRGDRDKYSLVAEIEDIEYFGGQGEERGSFLRPLTSLK
jgi:hypothetical protein